MPIISTFFGIVIRMYLGTTCHLTFTLSIKDKRPLSISAAS